MLRPQTRPKRAEGSIPGGNKEVTPPAVAVQLVDGAGWAWRCKVLVQKLLVVITIGINFGVNQPAVAHVGSDADIVEIRGDVVVVVSIIISLCRIINQQIPVTVLCDLSARGGRRVGCVGPQLVERCKCGDRCFGCDPILILSRKGISSKEVVTQVSVGPQLQDVEQQDRK